MRKIITISLLAVLVAAAAIVGVSGWRRHVISLQRQKHTAAIERMIHENRPQEALAVIQAARRQLGSSASPAEQIALRQSELSASLQLRDGPRLLAIFQQSPDLIEADEEASLLVVRALLASRHLEEAAKLRASWRTREGQPANWFHYDADEALLRDPEEARTLLTSRTLEGAADCARLLRLASLNLKNPAEAVKYLDAAYAADPHNPDVRSFRGQILENAGQDALARVEYTAAVLAAPDNPLLRDQLAGFYLRKRSYAMAVQTLADAGKTRPLDFIHAKALFWSRVASPLPESARLGDCPEGGLKAFADYLAKIPADQFWDETEFAKLPTAARLEAERHEVLWLRLLDHLRNHREREASELLAASPFKERSLDPGLESALRIILKYRLAGFPPVAGDFHPSAGESHQLFKQMAAWAQGEPVPGIEVFAAGPGAFAGVFLAAGWTEAALHLAPTDSALTDAPDWLQYGLAQALRQNRGNAEALAFAQKQPESSLMRLVTGELLFATNEKARATETLRPIATEDSDAGYRAACLLAIAALGERNAEAAREFIRLQPRLASSTQGSELNARCLLVEGRTSEATELYTAIEKESLEAKTYLARLAVAGKRWDEARRLTQELSALQPDDMRHLRDLAAIDNAASKP